MALAPLLFDAFGTALPIRLEMYDGSSAGSTDPVAIIRVNSRTGLARVLSRPGELGLVRAYVSGDVDIEGDLLTMLEISAQLDLDLHSIDKTAMLRLLRETGPG